MKYNFISRKVVRIDCKRSVVSQRKILKTFNLRDEDIEN